MSYTPSIGGDVRGPTANNQVFQITGPSPIFITPAVLEFLGTTVSPSVIQQANAAAANATDILFAAQDTTNTNFNSGNIRIRAGRKTGGPGLAGFVILECGTANNIEIGRFGIADGAGHSTGLTFGTGLGTPRVTVATPAVAANGGSIQFYGGSAGGAGNNASGSVTISTGQHTGTGLRGSITFGMDNGAGAENMLTLGEGVANQRLLGILPTNVALPGANPGDMVAFWHAAATAPTSPPGLGTMLLWVDPVNSSLKALGSSGTTTTLAPAEPHCPRCGLDFALEWESMTVGKHLAICVPCMMIALDNAGISRDDYTITDK